MISIYFKLIALSLKSQLQHRASFVMLTATYFLGTFVEIIGIWVLFDRFKFIQGWTLEEVMLIYGIMNIGFSLTEILARGFDTFNMIVRDGYFDRILLRPLGTLLQVAARETQLMRIGRLLQGLIVLIIGFRGLELTFFSWPTLLILFSIGGIAALFFGLIILQATISFWTVETLELMNVTTFGGLEAGQYPMSIYNPWFRYIFTFIIPIATVVYYPIASFLHHENLPFGLAMLGPTVGFLFFWIACQIWKLGVRHYHSTGS